MGDALETLSVVPRLGDLVLPLLRRSCDTQPRVVRAASYPGFGVANGECTPKGFRHQDFSNDTTLSGQGFQGAKQ